MFGGMENYGPTRLRDKTTMTDTLLVTSNSPIQAFKTGGTTPMINLVPIGVVQFNATYSRNVLFDDCKSNFTNLAGNFITTSSSECNPGYTTSDGVVEILLNFNPDQVAPYFEIIAVPSISYDGTGSSGNVQFSSVESEVTKNFTTQKPVRYEARFKANSIPSLGSFTIAGTVMFYGLR